MQKKITKTQHQILNQLLWNKNGLSINALAETLKITRNAVQQHFCVLEGEGYIQKKRNQPTAGRPVGIYELTDQGINYFPKQYSWFCALILEDFLHEIGRERLPEYMKKLGLKLAANLHGRFAEKTDDNKLAELTELLSELGFQAQSALDENGELIGIEAFNCIYHDLAQNYPEICEFDVSLMSALLGKPLEHKNCMAKGDGICCFRIKNLKI